MKSSIDLGTNTCLLLIAEWDPVRREVTRTIKDYATVVRLGEGVDQNHMLADGAMKRTLDSLKDYARKVGSAGLSHQETICVATSQARDAQNGAEFFSRIEKETGFRFRIISGDEEAKLTFRGGLLPGMDPAHSVVIDIGGGSTEFMSQTGGQSLDIGSVRFTERYLRSNPVKDDEFWACQEAIDGALEQLRGWRTGLSLPLTLVAVAGTATTLASWHLGLREFDAEKVDQVILTRGDVHRMVEELKWRTIDERQALPGVPPMRADVLLAGAMILWRAMELLDFHACHVSTRGLRYGALSLDC